MKKEFNVKDTESYKAGYTDYWNHAFDNRYMWAANAHTFNNWLDGWNAAWAEENGKEQT